DERICEIGLQAKGAREVSLGGGKQLSIQARQPAVEVRHRMVRFQGDGGGEAALGLRVPAKTGEGHAKVEPSPEPARVAVRRLLQQASGVLVTAASQRRRAG